MPDDPNPPEAGAEGSSQPEFKAITSQDDLNRIVSERVKREQAKFADYKDLKSKAAEFDKLSEANKSEIEKANERVSKAEAEVAAVPAKVADALRGHLVSLHGIEAEDAELFLTASDPELLLKQVDRLLGRAGERKKQGNHAPREGGNPAAPEDPKRQVANQLFGGG